LRVWWKRSTLLQVWVIRAGVDVVDAELAENDLQGGAAAAPGCGGEDGAVVGHDGRRGAEVGEGVGERLDDVVAAHGGVGAAGQDEPGVVVEDVEDLRVGVIGEVPVGDVGLPEFVGLVGGEAFPGRAGSFVGLGCDESAFVQDPPNRGYRRRIGDGGVAGQVFGDGGCAGVVALFG